jgi:predicted DNA-binding WGR domain protein
MGEHLERASTGRAKCKVCKEAIDKGALRMGTSMDSSSFDGSMTVWTHALCAAMRSPTPFLRALAGYEGKVPAAEKKQLEAIANTTRAKKLKQVVWRHRTETRCLLEFAQDYYVLFSTVIARGTLDEVIASVPDEDLEDVVDTATASGKTLGRAKPVAKPAEGTAKLRARYETKHSGTTYAYEIHLDEAKQTVTSWMEINSKAYGKQKKKKLESVEQARKYFRYMLSDHQPAEFVDGDRVPLDPDEDFKDVKEKSPDYRYLENAKTKQFFDIDRDSSEVHVWEGTIGTKGGETVSEHNWDGEAKQHYKELLAAKQAEGYTEPPGFAGRRAAGKR